MPPIESVPIFRAPPVMRPPRTSAAAVETTVNQADETESAPPGSTQTALSSRARLSDRFRNLTVTTPLATPTRAPTPAPAESAQTQPAQPTPLPVASSRTPIPPPGQPIPYPESYRNLTSHTTPPAPVQVADLSPPTIEFDANLYDDMLTPTRPQNWQPRVTTQVAPQAQAELGPKRE
jgi:hypothetical protein